MATPLGNRDVEGQGREGKDVTEGVGRDGKGKGGMARKGRVRGGRAGKLEGWLDSIFVQGTPSS